MEKLQSITIEKNEAYLRQISKKVNINDPELHNNIVVLQDYCMQNDVMAMAAVQLGIPKRIIYVKNTNLDILNKRLTDEGKEETKDYNEAKILINTEIINEEEKEVTFTTKGKKKKNLINRMKNIEVKRIVHDLSDEEKICSQCGK